MTVLRRLVILDMGNFLLIGAEWRGAGVGWLPASAERSEAWTAWGPAAGRWRRPSPVDAESLDDIADGDMRRAVLAAFEVLVSGRYNGRARQTGSPPPCLSDSRLSGFGRPSPSNPPAPLTGEYHIHILQCQEIFVQTLSLPSGAVSRRRRILPTGDFGISSMNT